MEALGVGAKERADGLRVCSRAMSSASLPRPLLAGRSLSIPRPLAIALGLGALVAASLAIRTIDLGAHYWIDEGISTGIASHPLTAIPNLMLQDGSPPLYYLLLHLWISLTGSSELQTHVLSALFAVATVPVGWWAGRTLFDPRVGWIAAGLFAFNTFLTSFANETRMYSLVILLAIPAVTCFVQGFVYRPATRARRRCLAGFAASLVLLLYTHNWALYFTLASLVALAVVLAVHPRDVRRPVLREAAMAYAAAAVLYAPWVPSLIEQVRHTGAPWAVVPGVHTLAEAAPSMLGGNVVTIALGLAAGAGVLTVLRRWRADRERAALLALLILAVVTVVVPWVISQVEVTWASRYLAIALSPLLLLLALGLSRAGGLGIACMCVLAIWWLPHHPPASRSNAHYVAHVLAGALTHNDVVLVTQPEQVPVLAHYLPHDLGLRYVTPLGPVPDVNITDWRDGVARMHARPGASVMRRALETVPVGGRVLFVKPILSSKASHSDAPWTKVVRHRSHQWHRALYHDAQFLRFAREPGPTHHHPGPNPLRGAVYMRLAR
jgi:hypothetical protein